MIKKERQCIRIKFKAYDHKLLDKSSEEIVKAMASTCAEIRGPIPFPTRISKYTVLRSPHVDKKSREQFEIRTYKRIIDVFDPSPQTVDTLMKLSLPAGVNVEVEINRRAQ